MKESRSRFPSTRADALNACDRVPAQVAVPRLRRVTVATGLFERGSDGWVAVQFVEEPVRGQGTGMPARYAVHGDQATAAIPRPETTPLAAPEG